MQSDNAEKGAPSTKVWYRSKLFFIAFVALITLLIVSIYVDASLFHQKPSTNNLVCFTCRPSAGNQTFAIAAEISVTDGMNQSEAIKVATKVFERAFEIDPNYQLRSVSVWRVSEAQGIWAVDFYVVYTASQQTSSGGRREHAWELRISHGYFKVVINPFDQTVVYSN